jgi:hypothetical protein
MNVGAALAWIQSNATNNTQYTIIAGANETVTPVTLSVSSKNIYVTIRGNGATRTLLVNGNEPAFTVGSGVALTLDTGITLSRIKINTGGTVIMNAGATLTGSTNGGAVEVLGTFIMDGGTITKSSTGSYGGGVYVNGGTFTMNAGIIDDNSAGYYGGGVYLSGGTFAMKGGTINNNTASYGGGVYVSGGNFTKTGGIISGSDATGTNEYGSPLIANIANSFSAGYAVYVSDGKKRNTTAGYYDQLNSSQSGSVGGWE